MKIMTVEEQWAGYAAAVMPPGAPPVQRREMRRAFYAGVYSLLLLCRDVLGSPLVSEAEGERALESQLAECEAFQREMLEGRA